MVGQHMSPLPDCLSIITDASKNHQKTSYRTAFHSKLLNCKARSTQFFFFSECTDGFATKILSSCMRLNGQCLPVRRHLRIFTTLIISWNALSRFKTILVLQIPEHTDIMPVLVSTFLQIHALFLRNNGYRNVRSDSWFMKVPMIYSLQLVLTSNKRYPVIHKPVPKKGIEQKRLCLVAVPAFFPLAIIPFICPGCISSSQQQMRNTIPPLSTAQPYVEIQPLQQLRLSLSSLLSYKLSMFCFSS